MTDSQSEEVVFAESAIDASIVVCLALATKNHLLGMWGLSEESVDPVPSVEIS
jgi:hypothetical protein